MPRRLLQQLLGMPRPSHSLAGLSRRDLLKRGLAAASALLSGTVMPRPVLAATNPSRVVVVGAGFAGLACAYELAQAGYAVKVLEARRRVGGRIVSLKDVMPGAVIEGGGELLGSNHPHVLAYAAKFGFRMRDVTESADPAPLILQGQMIPADEQRALAMEVEAAYAAMTAAARSVVTEAPWRTPDADRLDRLTTGQWIDSLPLSSRARALLSAQFTADNGVAVQRQSYLGNLAQVNGGGLEKYWTDTEVYRLEGGNQQYALQFARELGDDRVVLGSPVRSIEVRGNGVRVTDTHGTVHEGDDVVLATPPSTWATIQFSPTLPRGLMPQMGSNVKYLAVMDHPYWFDSKTSPDGNSDALIQATWNATDGQVETGPVVHTAFSGGPSADTLNTLPAAERDAAYRTAWEQLYPGFGAAFQRGLFMNWVADPWARAGYSFPAPGQVVAHGPLLQDGLGRMHFAGEHTCYAFVGYMEGALHSGEAVARRIAIRDGIMPRP